MCSKRKLGFYVIASAPLAMSLLQGTVEFTRRTGRQEKRWEYNIRDWTGHSLRAEWNET